MEAILAKHRALATQRVAAVTGPVSDSANPKDTESLPLKTSRSPNALHFSVHASNPASPKDFELGPLILPSSATRPIDQPTPSFVKPRPTDEGKSAPLRRLSDSKHSKKDGRHGLRQVQSTNINALRSALHKAGKDANQLYSVESDRGRSPVRLVPTPAVLTPSSTPSQSRSPKRKISEPEPPVRKRRKTEEDLKLTELMSYFTLQDANQDQENSAPDQAADEDHTSTPLFSQLAKDLLKEKLSRGESNEPFPQYGLIGMRQSKSHTTAQVTQHPDTSNQDKLIFANMNSPWSAFICGSQGAGKSHTLSVLLENALMKNNKLNHLPSPLTGLVLHYDKFCGDNSSQICEAAYLCSAGIPVNVLVSPSNIWALTKLYTELPGLTPEQPKPKVSPLYISEKQLNTARVMALMSVNEGSGQVPLYMEVVSNILREMAMQGQMSFNYDEFRSRLESTEWVRGQKGPLSMRLELLESFLEPSKQSRYTRPAMAKEDVWSFAKGSLTIIDLSDPFIGEGEACALFNMCLSIFMERRGLSGRIIALDEAHKVHPSFLLLQDL